MDPTVLTVIGLAVPLVSAGAAWGGVKVGLNGQRRRQREIADDVQQLRKGQVAVRSDLSEVKERVGVLWDRSERRMRLNRHRDPSAGS